MKAMLPHPGFAAPPRWPERPFSRQFSSSAPWPGEQDSGEFYAGNPGLILGLSKTLAISHVFLVKILAQE
jgi:hypothetical protein